MTAPATEVETIRVPRPDELAYQMDRIIDAHAGRHHHVVVAAMPKSASTFLFHVLANVTGFRRYWLCPLGHDSERDIQTSAVPMLLAQDTVSVEHMTANAWNFDYLDRLKLKATVLVRDVFDVIISTADHVLREGGQGPMLHLPRGFETRPREQQLACIAHLATPWYLRFVTSWLEASRTRGVLWITYDELTTRTTETVRRILEHQHVEIDEHRIAAGLEATDLDAVRFNCGRSGRGRDELPADLIDVVEALAEPFRAFHDLSCIGLP